MSRRMREKARELTDRFVELTSVRFVFIIPSWAKPLGSGKRPEDRVMIFGGSKDAKATIMKEAVKSVRAMDAEEEERAKDLAKHRPRPKPTRINEVQAMREEDRRIALADEDECVHGSSKTRCEACTPRERRKATVPDHDLLREVDLDIL